MKKLIAIMRLLIVIFSIFFYGCNSSSQKDYINEVEKEQAEKSKNLAIAADSIVNLSFGGLSLGAPASYTIDKAIKDKTIWDVTQNKENSSIRFKANIFLPERENPLCIDGIATIFNDSISSICVVSEDFETHQELINLYESRYNDKYASLWEDKAELWGNNSKRSGDNSKVWAFKNQTLRVSNFYEEERENYIKDPRMKAPENRYDVKYTKYFKCIIILYNDIKLCKKAEEYLNQQETRLKIEQQKENEKIKIQQKANVENQDI